MKRRSTDATQAAGFDRLACPDCNRPLKRIGEDLVCSQGHRFMTVDGYYDLWPTNQPQPPVDWFATPYGIVYDTAIKERWLARWAGRLGWGADIGKMFEMMDEGVKCAPGYVILDVPVGGAPALRAAAGRMRGAYVGIDLSPEMLRRAARERAAEALKNVVLARADAARLPIRSNSIDRVLCFNGLHVLPDKAAVMREFRRVLKPGGQLWGNVVTIDNKLGSLLVRPWFSGSWLFFHPADPNELEEVALASGFSSWEQEVEGSMLFFRGVRASKVAQPLVPGA
jgi:SAM-dependent methyltransferase